MSDSTTLSGRGDGPRTPDDRRHHDRMSWYQEQGRRHTTSDSTTFVCPTGYACDPTANVTVSCDDLRTRYSAAFGFGDVLGGISCPEGEVTIRNCDVGRYCPDSSTSLPCPKGKYCPHKTAAPEVSCSQCDEGSVEFQRQTYGYVVVGIVCATTLLLIGWVALKHYNKQLANKVQDLASRTISSTRRAGLKRKEDERLERIRPRLELIADRVHAAETKRLEEAQSRDETMVFSLLYDFEKGGKCNVPRDALPAQLSLLCIDRETWEKVWDYAQRTAEWAMPREAIKRQETAGGDLDDSWQPGEKEREDVEVLLAEDTAEGWRRLAKKADTMFGPEVSVTPVQDEGGVFIGLKFECKPARLPQDAPMCPRADILSADSKGKLAFDSGKLFDICDADGSGDLCYVELNKILDLNHLQLREFVIAMNNMAGVSRDATTVSRVVFVEHFLAALERSRHFGPNADEAAALFDDIARDEGTEQDGSIKPESLFSSRIADFLSDSEINDLIKRFGRKKLMNATSRRSDRAANLSIQLGDTVDRALPLKRAKTRRKIDSGISREDFIDWYPTLLNEVTTKPDPFPKTSVSVRPSGDEEDKETLGVDITFEDLSLTIKAGEKSFNVVDHVSGRLKAKTMTALMGGSGAGKTSLLNALCGRAFYGEVTGSILVNGQKASIEEHKDSVGFVPQDDIVYAELTVRENFIYAGRFQLEAGTPLEEIEDLADATMANLGLSRVANSIVGDVTRRGVSGGEKKRVNIGLEVMSRPKILFLDEPTSGLDASSAMLVMQSLRTLCDTQGVTVCSVIHQPRKFIFDLFDSVYLLGVGGKTVYHGPVCEAEEYFSKLNYVIPAGESVADWLIDVSSGRLEPEKGPPEKMKTPTVKALRQRKQSSIALINHDTAACQETSRQGSSASQIEQDFERAKLVREELYRHWNEHFSNLSGLKKELYEAPIPHDLPANVKRPSFFKQLTMQMERNMLVIRRNIFSKLVDTAIIVGAVMLMAGMEGVIEVTTESHPDIPFDILASEDPAIAAKTFPELFKYGTTTANLQLQNFGMKVGVILCVLVGLTATKILCEKRLEFFREAGSGYDVNAYFLSVNLTCTVEHTIQVLLSASASLWLRNSLVSWQNYFVHFLMIQWLCVSWALFLPLLVPPRNVVLVVGFFMAFFGLLFSGAVEPTKYADLYNDDNKVLAVFSGFVATPRYFTEGLTVAEQRCLPSQSGFTVDAEDAINFPMSLTSFNMTGLGLNDSGVIERNCKGWYWGVLPALFVGLTIRCVAAATIHVSGRSKQSKTSLRKELSAQIKKPMSEQLKWNNILVIVGGVVALTVLLFSLSTYFILRET